MLAQVTKSSAVEQTDGEPDKYQEQRESNNFGTILVQFWVFELRHVAYMF